MKALSVFVSCLFLLPTALLADMLSMYDQDGQEPFTPACTIAYTDANCQTVNSRDPSICLNDGISMMEDIIYVIKNNGAYQQFNGGVCRNLANTGGTKLAHGRIRYNCNDHCIFTGHQGGTCEKSSINCAGMNMDAGYCVCTENTVSTTPDTSASGSLAVLTAPTGMPISCEFYALQLQNSSHDPLPVASAATFSLSTNSGTGHFYSDSSCTSQISSVSIAANTDVLSFFYSDSSTNDLTLTLSETTSYGIPNKAFVYIGTP